MVQAVAPAAFALAPVAGGHGVPSRHVVRVQGDGFPEFVPPFPVVFALELGNRLQGPVERGRGGHRRLGVALYVQVVGVMVARKLSISPVRATLKSSQAHLFCT